MEASLAVLDLRPNQNLAVDVVGAGDSDMATGKGLVHDPGTH